LEALVGGDRDVATVRGELGAIDFVFEGQSGQNNAAEEIDEERTALFVDGQQQFGIRRELRE